MLGAGVRERGDADDPSPEDGSGERGEAQYAALFERTGLEQVGLIETSSMFHVLGDVVP